MENNRHLQFVLRHYREGAFNTRSAIDRFHKATGRPDRGFIRYMTAAAVFAAILTGIYIFNSRPQPTLVAAAEVAHTVFLPDGSEVVLAPHSTMEFDMRGFMRKSRSVTMNGKAFFDVARNEETPFEITAANAYIKVLGTSFQVDGTSEKGTRVYVRTGKVLFSKCREMQGIVLTKGMEARIGEGEAIPQLQHETSPNPDVWATGLFEYESVPLEDVLKELSEFYGVCLTASDYGHRLTAKFETSATVEEIMEMIGRATGTEIKAGDSGSSPE